MGILDVILFEGLPVELNLGHPEQTVGRAKGTWNPDTHKTTIKIELDESTSQALSDLAEVFEFKAIGFAGIKQRPQDRREEG